MESAERPYFAAWGMYQFTNPFITCPPAQQLAKVHIGPNDLAKFCAWR
jgi:hypothetical protein